MVPAQVDRDHLVQLRLRQTKSISRDGATLAGSRICFSGEQIVWMWGRNGNHPGQVSK